MSKKNIWSIPAVALLLATAACGGEESAPTSEPSPAAAPAAPTAQAPEGGNVIEVKMSMSGANGVFEPAQVTAKPGDVIRFVNMDNVHNVSFPAAQNPGASGLPTATPFLTGAGDAYDMKVDLTPGSYNFQCDPHAAMGMKGQLTVSE